MAGAEFETILHRLARNGATFADRPAYHDRLSGHWLATTWGEFDRLTHQAARAMLALGVDDGSVVSILGPNRPEWTISALGGMRLGGIAAGIYTTSSAAEVAYVLGHSESPVAVVENQQQLAKVEEKWSELPSLKHVIVMDGSFESGDPRILGWADFLSRGDEVAAAEVDGRLNQLRGDQVAVFIYTSGTTGPPKAVMLTHDNIVFTADLLGDAVKSEPDDVMLSYLPLSHIAEQMASVHIAIARGYTVYYCHEGLKLAEYLKEVEPTTFFGVPRVWERFETVVNEQFSTATGAKLALLNWARATAVKVTELTNAGQTPTGALAAQYRLADRLVLSKVRAAMGFARQKTMVSGAAPTPIATLEFFASLGMTILEVYGQSEDSGPTSSNLPGAVKFGSVGRPFPGVEVKLSGDDEILVRGRNVFAGYYKDEAATAETVIDGWLQSGDLGRFDDDGFLYITGRSKDIIITSGGKNIAPRNIEEALTGIDVVSQAVCVGEQQRYLVALITLDPGASIRWAAELGVSSDELATSEALRVRLERDVTERVNSQFARVEHIRNFVILPREFSVEDGELTPTFKIKRSVVNQMYASEIASAYSAGQVL